MANGSFAGGFAEGVAEGQESQRRNAHNFLIGARIRERRDQLDAERKAALVESARKNLKQIFDEMKASIDAGGDSETAARFLDSDPMQALLDQEAAKLGVSDGATIAEQIKARLNLMPSPAQRGSAAGVEAAAKTEAEIGRPLTEAERLEKAGIEPHRPQSPLGKLLFDRDLAARQFGEDSPQAQAFDDALEAEASGGAASLTDIRGVRQEYTKQSGAFIATQDAYGRVLSSPDTAGGDVALVFNFMKMLDPGSVVREGEFAVAAAAAGLPDRLVQLARRVDTGERLTPTQRKDFVAVAGAMFKDQFEGQRLRAQTFNALAVRLGMDPSKVVIPFIREKYTEFAPDPAGGAEASAPPDLPSLSTAEEVEKLEPGTHFIWTPTGQTLRKD